MRFLCLLSVFFFLMSKVGASEMGFRSAATPETVAQYETWRDAWMKAAVEVDMIKLQELAHPEVVLIGSAVEEYFVGRAQYIEGLRAFMGKFRYSTLNIIREEVFENETMVWVSAVFQPTIFIKSDDVSVQDRRYTFGEMRATFLLTKGPNGLRLIQGHNSEPKPNPQ